MTLIFIYRYALLEASRLRLTGQMGFAYLTRFK